ncbi:MAG: hypothetical protein ACTTJO_01125 [Metamycoplasmataceae bacterium]
MKLKFKSEYVQNGQPGKVEFTSELLKFENKDGFYHYEFNDPEINTLVSIKIENDKAYINSVGSNLEFVLGKEVLNKYNIETVGAIEIISLLEKLETKPNFHLIEYLLKVNDLIIGTFKIELVIEK